MKNLALMLLLTSSTVFAGPDIYEKYEGISDKNEICSFTVSKYPDDDSFHYLIEFPHIYEGDVWTYNGEYSLWGETLPAQIPFGKYADPQDPTTCGYDTKREDKELSMRRYYFGDLSHYYTQADFKYSDSSLSKLVSLTVRRATGLFDFSNSTCLALKTGLQKKRTCKKMKRVQ